MSSSASGDSDEAHDRGPAPAGCPDPPSRRTWRAEPQQAEGTWQVTATSAADPAVAAKASVVVAAVPVISIALEPLAASVRAGGTLRFSAVVSNAPNPDVLCALRSRV